MASTTAPSAIVHLLESLTSLLAKTNDTLLLTSPWILTATTDPALEPHLPSPLLTTLTYAILEPCFTALLQWLRVPTWLFLDLLPAVHIFQADRCSRMIASAREENRDEHSLPISAAASRRIFRSQLRPVVSAAALNAALLVSFRRLAAEPWNEKRGFPGGAIWTEALALLLYVYGRWGDFTLCRCADKPMLPLFSVLVLGEAGGGGGGGGRRTRMLLEQLSCILCLGGVKTSLRVLLGVDPRIAFRRLSADRAMRHFGPKSSRWFFRWVERVAPPWYFLMWAYLSAAFGAFMLFRWGRLKWEEFSARREARQRARQRQEQHQHQP